MGDDNTTHQRGRIGARPLRVAWKTINRRDFLLAVGVAGTGSIAGCTDSGDNDDTTGSSGEAEADTGASDEPGTETNDQHQGEGESESESNDDTEESTESDEGGDESQYADMRVYAMDRETGEYQAGAEVTLENRNTGETYTLTTEYGEEFDDIYARFRDLPLGTYYVTVVAEGYEEATNTIQLVESGRQPILHLVPTSTQTADMRVYAENADTNEYMSGIDITVKNQDTEETYTLQTVDGVEFDGKYARFRNLPLGTYTVIARHSEFLPARSTIELGESGRQPILEMEPAPSDQNTKSTFSGSFIYAIDEDPFEGIVILTHTESGDTYSDDIEGGTGTVTVPVGWYILDVTSNKGTADEFRLSREVERTINLTESDIDRQYRVYSPPRQYYVEGRIINSATGEPLSGVTFGGSSPSTSDPYQPEFSLTTDDNGVYSGTIGRPADTGYEFTIHVDGYEPYPMPDTMPSDLRNRTFELNPLGMPDHEETDK